MTNAARGSETFMIRFKQGEGESHSRQRAQPVQRPLCGNTWPQCCLAMSEEGRGGSVIEGKKRGQVMCGLEVRVRSWGFPVISHLEILSRRVTQFYFSF